MENHEVSSPEHPALRSALDRILTAAEYSRLEHLRPYIFELRTKDNALCFFGASHTRDAKHPVFPEIKKNFFELHPDLVLVEGMGSVRGTHRAAFLERLNALSTEEAVERLGESGFTIKLAAEHGIEWASPEPPFGQLYEHLLTQGFTKDDLLAWEVLHILPQYNRLPRKEGFPDYVAGYLSRLQQVTRWHNFDYSYDRAIRLGEALLGTQIDVENEPRALAFIDPIPWSEEAKTQTALNRISEATSVFRDRHIVREIASAMRTHHRIYVVYGSSHAVMLEPALRTLFGAGDKSE
jgi:hypothetical protein